MFARPPAHLRRAGLSRRPGALPAAAAAVTLETFSDQGGAHSVSRIEAVRGVATRPVSGVFAVRDALERRVARTALKSTHDRDQPLAG